MLYLALIAAGLGGAVVPSRAISFAAGDVVSVWLVTTEYAASADADPLIWQPESGTGVAFADTAFVDLWIGDYFAVGASLSAVFGRDIPFLLVPEARVTGRLPMGKILALTATGAVGYPQTAHEFSATGPSLAASLGLSATVTTVDALDRELPLSVLLEAGALRAWFGRTDSTVDFDPNRGAVVRETEQSMDVFAIRAIVGVGVGL